MQVPLLFERVLHFNKDIINTKTCEVTCHLMIEAREVRGGVCAPELCHGDRVIKKPYPDEQGAWFSKISK